MSIIPVVQDYPDYTRLSQFTSSAILDVTDTATSVTKTLGTFYTGGFESLVLRSFNQAAGVGWVYNLSWFSDTALTKLVGQTNLRTISAIPISAQIPNRGPWCTISVTTTSLVAHAFRLLVLPRTGTPSGAGAFLDGLVHGAFGQVIAGGATFAQNGFGLTPGPAQFSVVTSAVSWRASVEGLDELVAGVGVFGGLNSNGGTHQSQRIMLPPYWTQLQITNNDAGNQTFHFSVQAEV